MYLSFFRLQGYPGELGPMGSPGEQGQMVSICDDCACAIFLIFTIVFELIEMKSHSFTGSTWRARTTWLCWTKWPTRRCYTLICFLFVSVRNKLLFSRWFGKRRTPSSDSLWGSFSFPSWGRGCGPAPRMRWKLQLKEPSRRLRLRSTSLLSFYFWLWLLVIFKGQRGELGKDGKPGLVVSEHNSLNNNVVLKT